MMGPKLVSESDGDGYTIGMGGSPHNEVGLLTMEGMFEPDDICMLAGLTRDAAVIQVRDDAPWDTLEEFIEDARIDQAKLLLVLVLRQVIIIDLDY